MGEDSNNDNKRMGAEEKSQPTDRQSEFKEKSPSESQKELLLPGSQDFQFQQKSVCYLLQRHLRLLSRQLCRDPRGLDVSRGYLPEGGRTAALCSAWPCTTQTHMSPPSVLHNPPQHCDACENERLCLCVTFRPQFQLFIATCKKM